jgi:adenosylhomocysteine nucleosidase
MRIGIMSAIPEENSLLHQQIAVSHDICYADRLYTNGSWLDHEIVLVFSRWGKVAAAITATHLIAEFKVDGIIFTGVAGACASGIQIGDIIIANSLVQHDMDATPFFPRHEIPLIGLSSFQMDEQWKNHAYRAAHRFLNNSFQTLTKNDLDLFGISVPKIHEGLIATGDKFFASARDLTELLSRLPQALCVEMEGGAVAQVCHEYKIPCTIIRIISDSGNESSPKLFSKFVSSISSQYSLGILKELLQKLS